MLCCSLDLAVLASGPSKSALSPEYELKVFHITYNLEMPETEPATFSMLRRCSVNEPCPLLSSPLMNINISRQRTLLQGSGRDGVYSPLFSKRFGISSIPSVLWVGDWLEYVHFCLTQIFLKPRYSFVSKQISDLLDAGLQPYTGTSFNQTVFHSPLAKKVLPLLN